MHSCSQAAQTPPIQVIAKKLWWSCCKATCRTWSIEALCDKSDLSATCACSCSELAQCADLQYGVQAPLSLYTCACSCSELAQCADLQYGVQAPLSLCT